VLRSTIRFLLRTWSRFPKAPGYLYQIVERWGARLGVKPLECRLFNGTKMSCDLGDQIQRQIYFFGAYEPIEVYLLTHLLRPGMVVIDAGANVGQHTLIAAVEVGRRGEVHAFEPVPKNFRRLVAHVSDNGLGDTVRTNRMALWHEAETVRLSLGSDKASDGGYTIGAPSEAIHTVACSGIRLDDYVAERKLDRVDFIKMDIEGAEWFALKGATSVLARWRPTMLVEINRGTCRGLGYEPERIWEFLTPYGYSMWAVGQSPEMCRALSSLDGVEGVNVIFHTGQLPTSVIKGWSYKSVLRFHRRTTRVEGDRRVSPTASDTHRPYARIHDSK
jgi:FkbM family methyltransferase